MDLNQALSTIKKSLSGNKIIESKHFKEECTDKNLPVEEITKIITENEVLGIVQQEQNVYKVWFFYTSNKDLNIILRILPEEKLRLITLYPCNAERRKREHAPKS